MQDDDWGSIWVVSKINCLKPCVVIRESIRLLLRLVMSFGHHVDDLALKSPKITVNCDFIRKLQYSKHIFKTRKEGFKFNTALARRPVYYSSISFLFCVVATQTKYSGKDVMSSKHTARLLIMNVKPPFFVLLGWSDQIKL